MELKFNFDKVVKVVIEKDKDNLLEYNFENGLIVSVSEYSKNKQKVLTDKEMVEKIKHSKFMNELDNAKKNHQIHKENVHETKDTLNKPTHNKDVNIIKEIIKKDLDGTLDEIVQKKLKIIDKNITSVFDNDENQYDIYACQNNLKKIEQKLLSIIRDNNGDVKENKEFLKTLDDFKEYSKKYEDLSDKLWEKWKKQNECLEG